MENKLYFYKAHESAIIPSKRKEDAGYDLYALQTDEVLIIRPGETLMINTGIRTAFSSNYVMLARERGSTGTIGMKVGAGVIDSGYRGTIFIPINNTGNKRIIITPKCEEVTEVDDMIYYPKSKGICQVLMVPVQHLEVKELTEDEYNSLEKTERQEGALGSSGK